MYMTMKKLIDCFTKSKNWMLKKWNTLVDEMNPPAPDDYWIPWGYRSGDHSGEGKLPYSSRPRIANLTRDFYEEIYMRGYDCGRKSIEGFLMNLDGFKQNTFLNNLLEDFCRHKILLSKRIANPENRENYFYGHDNERALSIASCHELLIQRKLEAIEKNDIPQWLGTDTEFVELIAIGLENKKFDGTNKKLMADKIAKTFGVKLNGEYNSHLSRLQSPNRKKSLIKTFRELTEIENKKI